MLEMTGKFFTFVGDITRFFSQSFFVFCPVCVKEKRVFFWRF